MDAKAGFYALALSAALVMASGAMLSDKAMAQADDVAVQEEEASVEEASVEAAVATPQADDETALDEAVERPVPKQKPAVAERPVKSDLDQSAVRAAPVTSPPRPTRTSIRAIAVPKILGSYR